MKKPRQLTAEERRLWRESNRHTMIRRGKEIQGLDEDGAVATCVAVGARSGKKPGQLQNFSSPKSGGKMPQALNVSDDAKPASAPLQKGKEKYVVPLTPLTQREASKRFKPYGPAETTLDLHGMTKLEAHEKVRHFITRMQKRGCRHVAIITGKGRAEEPGALRSALPGWLNEPRLRGLISGFAHARPEKGGAGVTHVLLKR